MKSSVNDFKIKSTNLCFLNIYTHWQIPFTVLIREASLWTVANTDSWLFRALRISEQSVLNRTFISPTHARQPHRTLYQMWIGRMHKLDYKVKDWEMLPSGQDSHWNLFSQQRICLLWACVRLACQLSVMDRELSHGAIAIPEALLAV